MPISAPIQFLLLLLSLVEFSHHHFCSIAISSSMSDNQPVPEALADMLSRSTAPLALLLQDAVNWWDTVNKSVVWQDRIFHLLAALYGLVTAVALVQLVRIQLRVPEYGWTTQKVFHFLNFLVNAVRCLVFIFRRDIQDLEPEIFQHVVLDLPSLAFFTTYALLVLFWAEIYYQARAVSTDWLGPTFYTINGVVYAIQIILWVVQWWKPIHATVILSRMFFAGVSLFAALGFILYGGSSYCCIRAALPLLPYSDVLIVQAVLDVTTIPRRIKRATQETTGGWLHDHDMLFMFSHSKYYDSCRSRRSGSPRVEFHILFCKLPDKLKILMHDFIMVSKGVFECDQSTVFAAGGDLAFSTHPVYTEEAAPKARDHTISSNPVTAFMLLLRN
ncbi:hypothetical protein SASPL_116028 [Salvia splendens]|uniref:THH1/TOM1/TOM3 domain-containing protein n=1 Tax=Salvia splendens TaxID=180675 RepID=A0A8X8Y7P1_SALSN|nr:hypothetical protein SASPL_116028 [Salvia splendens]